MHYLSIKITQRVCVMIVVLVFSTITKLSKKHFITIEN